MKKARPIPKSMKVLLVVVALFIAFVVFLNIRYNTPISASSKQTNSVKEEKKIETFAVGDTVMLCDLEITVKDYELTQKVGGLEYGAEAEDGIAYCVVHIDVKNNGKEAYKIETGALRKYDFVLYANNEYEYSNSWSYVDDFFYANDSIPANATLKGKILNYKIPEELVDSDDALNLVLKYSSFSGSEEINFKLRGTVEQ